MTRRDKTRQRSLRAAARQHEKVRTRRERRRDRKEAEVLLRIGTARQIRRK